MTTTTTSGAADLRTAAQAVVDRWDTPLWKDVPATAEYIGRLRAALAAGQATAAQQGAAYAEMTEKYYLAGGEVPTWDVDQMRAFADATCALRASHGQAPAGATELAEADRRAGAAERKLAASKEDVARIEQVRDKMKDQWGVDRRVSFDVVWAEALALKAGTKSDSGVLEDAALLDWLEQHDGRYYNLDKVAAIVGTGFLVRSEGNMPQVHSTLREAVYAARKQGASNDR